MDSLKSPLKRSKLILFSIILVSVTFSSVYFETGAVHDVNSDDIKVDGDLSPSNDGVTYYRINEYTFSYVDFNSGDSSYGDWSGSTPSGSLTFRSDSLEFQDDSWGHDKDDAPVIEFTPDPFWEGKITIEWRKSASCDDDDNLELRYLDGGSSWSSSTFLEDCDIEHDSNFEKIEVDVDYTDGTNSGDFTFGILFDRDWGISEEAHVDYIRIETYEFIIEETVADSIPQQNDQTISVFTYPDGDGFYSNDVVLQYRTNSVDLDSSNTEISYDSQGTDNWYDFTVPNSAYDYNDICYYRIKVNGSGSGGWTHYSDDYQTSNFETYDNTDPSFGSSSIDPSTVFYNDSITYSIDCDEISGDSGITSLVMYASNSSGVTDSDYAIPTSDSLPSMGGSFDFSIPRSATEYGTLYYFIRAIDSEGNTADKPEDSIVIYDSFAPNVVEDPSNTDDQNYLDDNYLYFDISEPKDASGLDDSSLALEVGENSDLSGGTTVITSFNKVGTVYNFTIFKSEYTGHSTLYYQLTGQDHATNSFSTDIKSFDIIDLEAPSISLNASESNHTSTPYYYEDVKMTFNSSELASGVGFDEIILYVKNGSTPLNDLQNSVQITVKSSQFDNYEFLIDSNLLSARNDLYWLVSTFDTNRNVRNLTGSFTVYDDVLPSIEFSYISPGNSVNHSDDAVIYYSLQDYPNGAGFNTDGSSLVLFYKVGSLPSDGTDGTPLTSSTTMGAFDTIGSCSIPDTEFAYGDTVYYWANVSDLSSNMDSTFEPGNIRSFVVVDEVAPTIVINPTSLDNSAYNNSKNINFTASEASDASGLTGISIYWAVENPSISIQVGNYDGTDSLSASGTGGDYGFKIDPSQIDGIYGDEVYFILSATDSEGNLKITTALSFMIDDIIRPAFSEGSHNMLDIINTYGKDFSVELWDPDYPTSSGISSIKIYYRLNNSDVDDIPAKYTDILTYSGTIQKNRKTYTVELPWEDSDSWLNNTDVYYFIRVEDAAGNINDSSINVFSVVEYFEFTVNLPVDAEPSELSYYYNVTQISLDIESEISTNLYYDLDGNPSGETPVYGSTYTNTISGLTEGYHNITIYYLNDQYFELIEFYIDLTPPSTIDDVNIAWTNNIIRLSWQLPESYDSLAKIEIWRSTNDGSFTKLTEVDSVTTLYSDIAVNSQDSYAYKIIVRDRAGNRSSFSSVVSVNPPLPIWIWFVIAGAAVGAVFTVLKLRQRAQTERSLQELGDMSVDEREKLFQYEQSKEKQASAAVSSQTGPFDSDSQIKEKVWKEIDWKSKAKMKEKIQAFWHQKVYSLVESAVRNEIDGKLDVAVKLYKFALRAAENCDDIDLEVFDLLREKIFSVYENPLKK